jgi:hypothetical protein
MGRYINKYASYLSYSERWSFTSLNNTSCDISLCTEKSSAQVMITKSPEATNDNYTKYAKKYTFFCYKTLLSTVINSEMKK